MKKTYMVLLTALVLVLAMAIPAAWTAYRSGRVTLVGGPYATGLLYDSGATGVPVFVDKTYVDSFVGIPASTAASVWFGATTPGYLTYEGATADAFETFVGVADASTDVIYLWPAPSTTGTFYPITTTTAITGSTISSTELGYLEGVGVTQLAGATTMTSAKFNYLNTASVASLAAATGVTFPSGITADVPLVVDAETVTVAMGSTALTVLGTYDLPATAYAAYPATVEVICGGTISGTNDVKTIALLVDGSTLVTPALTAAQSGDYVFTATAVIAGATTQIGFSTLLVDGATIVQTDTAIGALAVTGAATFSVRTLLANAGDQITNNGCVWVLKP
jgi:hypothetical protein